MFLLHSVSKTITKSAAAIAGLLKHHVLACKIIYTQTTVTTGNASMDRVSPGYKKVEVGISKLSLRQEKVQPINWVPRHRITLIMQYIGSFTGCLYITTHYVMQTCSERENAIC